ncbi:DVU_1551 family NTP transferase [Desulforamulus ruminis]|uniref:Metal-dependent phosphohydrolase HD sub domain protein n=1 Tax=Desulforamulus ruminis (strain ATCC 23193 / DSM 2154 / NCIMB 8452 / DL) TaxID=696281 RepID=F6DS55_DESRL|nr:NTP transferase domain-containing protein [Desulforamulus ruminis]AEG58817.1 metal-dependent phosphohydrolase HD sub domain protein [Desulforamulus ruminis DSM 2154]
MTGTAANLAALVLAAGFSSRMGRLKSLLPLGEATVIERSIGSFLEAGVQDVRVVLGHRSEEIARVLEASGVTTIMNHEYEEGMYSSIRAAVRSLEPKVEAFFLLPGDLPLVRWQTVQHLTTIFAESGKRIIYPCFNGERGHPPIISTRYAQHILSWHGEGGLRALLNQYEDDALDIEIADPGVLLDMDTPEDYQRAVQWFKRGYVPAVQECMDLLEELKVDGRIVEHGRAVAQLARKWAMMLNQCGCRLNLDLIQAAGLLHDLAKGKPDHARVGADTLRERGYHAVAEIVAGHMDLGPEADAAIDERAILFLADKMVQGVRRIPLEERFQEKQKRFAAEPEILKNINRRLNHALAIKARIENLLGFTIETMEPRG